MPTCSYNNLARQEGDRVFELNAVLLLYTRRAGLLDELPICDPFARKYVPVIISKNIVPRRTSFRQHA